MQMGIIIFFVFVIFGLLKMLYPPKITEKYDFKALEEKYERLFKVENIISGIAYIIGVLLITFLFTKSMVDFQRYILNSVFPHNEYVIGIHWACFLIPNLFISIILAIFVFCWLEKRILIGLRLVDKEDWKAILAYGEFKLGFRVKKVVMFLGYVIVPLGLIFHLLSMHFFVVIDHTGIKMHPYYSFKTVQYRWNDIERIKQVTLLGTKRAQHYGVIYLKDGKKIDTRNWDEEIGDLNVQEVLNFVSTNSNISIQYKEIKLQ